MLQGRTRPYISQVQTVHRWREVTLSSRRHLIWPVNDLLLVERSPIIKWLQLRLLEVLLPKGLLLLLLLVEEGHSLLVRKWLTLLLLHFVSHHLLEKLHSVLLS